MLTRTARPARRVVLDQRGRQVYASQEAESPASPAVFAASMPAQPDANPYRLPCGRVRIGPEDIS